MVQDLSYNLCESLVENIDGVAGIGKHTPTPITYLTQWKIVGNSEVHTLPYPDGIVLPQGYKRCEYLKFDGNSYINTGIKTANDIGYDLRFKGAEVKLLIGARYDLNLNGFVVGYFSNNLIAASYGGLTSTQIHTENDYSKGVHHMILDSVKFQIDDEVIDISSLRVTARSFFDIYLGTWNNNGAPDSRMWQSNIYDTVIYNTQGELWHGIPCLDDNDVPCFYDIVSQTAFYNDGTGTFTYKLYPQTTEIWSCGEYNTTDGKYHILVQPLGGSIADIALTEPLRKVNDVADTIEFANGVAIVTRMLGEKCLYTNAWYSRATKGNDVRWSVSKTFIPDIKPQRDINIISNLLCNCYPSVTALATFYRTKGIAMDDKDANIISIYDPSYVSNNDKDAFVEHLRDVVLVYELATPTTELVDAPQIEEAESYSMVISQGAKAVEWSSFETN